MVVTPLSTRNNSEEDLVVDVVDLTHLESAVPETLPRDDELTIKSDQLEAMLTMERDHYESPNDYLLKFGSKDAMNSHATESWRRRLCEWMFEVTDHFGYDREVVSVAAYLMDRSASHTFALKGGQVATKREYQLCAVAALYLAFKVHAEMDPECEESRLKLRLSHFVELSRGFFSEETIAAKETEILNALNWHVNPPTPASLISFFLDQLPDWSVANDDDDLTSPKSVITAQLFDVAKYLTELGVFIPEIAFVHKPSTVSFAAMLGALEYVNETYSFPPDVYFKFLDILGSFSPKFNPHLQDIKDLTAQLKKLATDFFPASNPIDPDDHQPITRSVSLVDVESADRPAATSNRRNKNNGSKKRSISPTCVSQAASKSNKHQRTHQEGPLPEKAAKRRRRMGGAIRPGSSLAR
ncbi:MAG: hypothetical protein SGILL_003819 [Bacillariaceae sp.]